MDHCLIVCTLVQLALMQVLVPDSACLLEAINVLQ